MGINDKELLEYVIQYIELISHNFYKHDSKVVDRLAVIDRRST